MAIKLNTLYFFSVMANSSSFNEAAEKLGVSQQALSKTLAQLEEDLGQPLILRNHRGGERLTDAGKLLLNRSQTLLHSVYELEHLFDSPTITKRPESLRMGFISVLGSQIRNTIQKWEESRDVELTLLLLHSHSRLEDSLLQEELDFGIASQPASSSELTSVLLRSVPFVIVGNKHMQGTWDELTYLSFGDDPQQGGSFNVWPEATWPRKILGKFDITMATQLCIQGIGCIHIPQSFFPIVGPLGLKRNDLSILCPPPFTAYFERYLIFANRDCPPHMQAFKDELLSTAEVK